MERLKHELEVSCLKNKLSKCLETHNYESNLSDLADYVDKLMILYTQDNLNDILQKFKTQIEEPTMFPTINLKKLENCLANIDSVDLLIDLISYFDIQFVTQLHTRDLILDKLKNQAQTIEKLREELSSIRQTIRENLEVLNRINETIQMEI